VAGRAEHLDRRLEEVDPVERDAGIGARRVRGPDQVQVPQLAPGRQPGRAPHGRGEAQRRARPDEGARPAGGVDQRPRVRDGGGERLVHPHRQPRGEQRPGQRAVRRAVAGQHQRGVDGPDQRVRRAHHQCRVDPGRARVDVDRGHRDHPGPRRPPLSVDQPQQLGGVAALRPDDPDPQHVPRTSHVPILLDVAVNLRDVARRAGVSVPTASRVLSGSDYAVRPELRARVEQAARELHYGPNAHARALLGGNLATVGVLAGDVGDPYFSQIIDGVQELASRHRLLVTICNTGRDVDRELEYLTLLHTHRTGVIIIAGSELVDERYRTGLRERVRAYLTTGGRVVAIGHPDLDVDGVLVDNARG